MSYILLDDAEIDKDGITLNVNPGDEVIITDESAEAEGEMRQLEIAINVTSAQIEDASEMHDEVQATLESGGLTAEAAVFVHRNLTLLDGLNGRRNKTYFTIQSFQQAGGRKAYTLQVMDNIKANLKKYWEKLKAFFNKWAERAYDFFSKHIGAIGRLEKAFDDLAKKANGKAGSPKETNVKISPALLKAMTKTDKADVPKIAETLSAGVATVKEVITISKKGLDDAKSLSSKAASATKAEDIAELETLTNTINTRFMSTDAKAVATEGKVDGLPGGSVIEFKEETRKNTDGQDYVSGVTVTPKAIDDMPSYSDGDEVKALDRGDIVQVANAGKSLCAAIRNTNAELYKTNSLFKSIMKEMESAAAKLEGLTVTPKAAGGSSTPGPGGGGNAASDESQATTQDDSSNNDPKPLSPAGVRSMIQSIPAKAQGSVYLTQSIVTIYAKAAQAAYTYASVSLSNLSTSS